MKLETVYSLVWTVSVLLAFQASVDMVSASAQDDGKLPSGRNGIAQNYLGDKGIEGDEQVVFVEDFQNATIEEVAERWESVQATESMSLSNDVPFDGEDQQSLLIRHVGGTGNGAHLYRRLDRGYEKLHYRFYVKFDEDCFPIHHFFHVGGYQPATAWPQGGAGVRPDGGKRFTVGVEPFGENWRWDLYAYWSEMRGSPPRGQTWGNSFVHDPRFEAKRGEWMCLEVMIEMNDVGNSNGELALWVDGELACHLGEGFPKGKWVFDKFKRGEGGDGVRWNDATQGSETLKFPEEGSPFEGFRWRTDEDLKLNFLWLLCYITKAPREHVSEIAFDHIVVAQDYIGPIQTATNSASSDDDCSQGVAAEAERPEEDFAKQDESPLATGKFSWSVSEPLVETIAEQLPSSPDNPWHAVKDPTIVRHDGRWHLFCTLRKLNGGNGKPPGYIRIGYLSFADWNDAADSQWELLDLSMGYHGAPQVFYFRPHEKWYLIYQLEDAERGISYGPCFSTTVDLNDPKSWSEPAPLYDSKPGHVSGWLDFWVICDAQKAHLFFTSLNGCLWRADTPIESFPEGFGEPQIVLRGDIFEASHTYKVVDNSLFLTIIEAQGASGGAGRRYFKAYTASQLDGEWSELAVRRDEPFAGGANIEFGEERWTDSISHGELIRLGIDEQLEIDPQRLQFLFQGLKDSDWQGGYGRLGWRLGLLNAKSE